MKLNSEQRCKRIKEIENILEQFKNIEDLKKELNQLKISCEHHEDDKIEYITKENGHEQKCKACDKIISRKGSLFIG